MLSQSASRLDGGGETVEQTTKERLYQQMYLTTGKYHRMLSNVHKDEETDALDKRGLLRSKKSWGLKPLESGSRAKWRRVPVERCGEGVYVLENIGEGM